MKVGSSYYPVSRTIRALEHRLSIRQRFVHYWSTESAAIKSIVAPGSDEEKKRFRLTSKMTTAVLYCKDLQFEKTLFKAVTTLQC